jgi:hypothetical protein
MAAHWAYQHRLLGLICLMHYADICVPLWTYEDHLASQVYAPARILATTEKPVLVRYVAIRWLERLVHKLNS